MNPQKKHDNHSLRAITGMETQDQLFNELRSEALQKGWEKAQERFIISRTGSHIQQDHDLLKQDHRIMKGALKEIAGREIISRVEAVEIQEIAKRTIKLLNYK